MGIVSRALVERLAGHRGMGDSSRTATLREIRAEHVRRQTADDAWKIAHAQDLGDHCYALTLLRGDEDATAIVTFRLESLEVGECTHEDVDTFLRTADGEYAAYHAVVFGRYGV